MKKRFLILSLSFLTACGGGSGGGDYTKPGEILTPEQRLAAESNAYITGMKSHIIVGGDDETVNPNIRATTSGGHGNGKLYDLENVIFQSADKEFSTPDEDFTMTFITDENGKIIAVKSMDDGSVDVFERHDDKSNRFDSPTEEIHARVNLIGKQLGLSYSDFGFVQVYEDSAPDNHMFIMPIAGGYQEKLVKAEELTQDATFHGIAVGSVGEANSTIEGERLDLYDSNAELVFNKDTGTETLTADFTGKSHQNDPWYKIVATRYDDGNAQIVFTDGTNIENERFMLRKDGQTVENFDSGKVINDSSEHRLSVNFEYFGDNKTAQESTGIIYFQQSETQDPSQDPNRVEFYMGFGGVVKK